GATGPTSRASSPRCSSARPPPVVADARGRYGGGLRTAARRCDVTQALDELDLALGGDVDDLHGVLRALRDTGPVARVRYFAEPAWIFTRYEVVDAAYRDDDLFPAAAAFKEMTEPVFGPNLQTMHGAEHQRNRALVSPSFRARVIPEYVRPILDEV